MYEGLEVLSDALCLVGESPLWLAEKKRLAWVDIRGKRLRTLDMASGAARDVILPRMTAFLSEMEEGGLVGGAVDGIYRIREDGAMTPVNNRVPLKGARYNDGKPGPDGRLYMGTFSRDGSAAFYRMDHDGSVTELFDGVGNSNGLDWDEKKGILYYIDTPTKRVDAFDFDGARGALSRRRTVFRYPEGSPDGMTIDAEGNLWTALWGGGAVVCVSPEEGRILRTVPLPASQPSCCVFAGDDLRDLVITSAATGVNLYDEPLSGATFRIRTDVPGKPHHKLRLCDAAQ